MDKHGYLGNAEIASVEGLYEQYLKDNNSVDPSWQQFFKGFDFARTNYPVEVEGSAPVATAAVSTAASVQIPDNLRKEFNVINLINGYRSRGHLFTQTNPVRERRHYHPTLDIENF